MAFKVVSSMNRQSLSPVMPSYSSIERVKGRATEHMDRTKLIKDGWVNC